jgi:hypothetical protein
MASGSGAHGDSEDDPAPGDYPHDDADPSQFSTQETPSSDAKLTPQSLPLQKRRRVGRACDECRRKKIKCDGKQPCTHCTVYSYGAPSPPFVAFFFLFSCCPAFLPNTWLTSCRVFVRPTLQPSSQSRPAVCRSPGSPHAKGRGPPPSGPSRCQPR